MRDNEKGDDNEESDDMMNTSGSGPTNFESVISRMGPPGLYQCTQILAIFTCIIPQAFLLISYVFIALEPPFTCSHVNETQLLGDNKIVIDHNATYKISYGSCEVTATLNQTQNTSEPRGHVTVVSCPDGYNYTGGKDVSIVTEWDLICGSSGIAELSQTVIPLGWLSGIFVATTLADKYGRKMTISVSAVLLSISEFSIAFAPNIYALIALRFLSGLLVTGLGLASFVLGAELLVSAHRETYGMVNGMLWAMCSMLLCGIGYAFRDSGWRTCQLCIAAVEAIPLLVIYFIDESALWLHSVGKHARAINIVKKACRVNGVDYCKEVEDTVMECLQGDKIEDSANGTVKYSFLDVMKDRKMRVVCLIMCLAWFTNDVTYYGLYLTASTLVGNFYQNMFFLALLGIPSGIMNLVMLKYKGRRFVTIFFLSMAAASLLVSTCLVATGLDTEHKVHTSTAFFLLGKFAMGASYNTLYMYTPEVFPTSLRSTCMGTCSAAACIGGMVAPYMLPLFDIASWAPGTLLGGLCLVTVILLPVLPETKGKQLPSGIGG